MNDQGFLQIASYLEIFYIFLVIGAAAALCLLIRAAIRKMSDTKETLAAMFLSKLSFPAAFLFVSLVLRIIVVREALFPSPKFHLYLDAALIFFFIFFLIRLVDALFLGRYKRKNIPYPLPKVLHSLILGIFYLIILFIILRDIAGINITPILATSAVLTMVVGLALQGVLGNLLSGISIHLTKSFTKGDWIGVGTDEGVVIDTNWRETKILDRESNIIVIPNNTIASEKIINFSCPDDKTALTIPVKASYEMPTSVVFDALYEVAQDVTAILENPAPQVYILSYDDFGISYVLKFWIKDFERKYTIMGEVGRLIWYKFKRNNIEIPFPLSDKLGEILGSIREKDRAAAVKEKMDKNFHDLINSSFLRYHEGEGKEGLVVSESALRDLASLVHRQRFACGEVIFKQGDKGESCFVVAKGAIKGEIVYHEKGRKYKSEFMVKPGGIFGEISLFTGMPRTATGIVDVESELLEIKALDFALLLERNPALAEVTADLVSKRNRKNQEFLKKIKELSAKDIKDSCSKQSILKRLRQFVKLSFTDHKL